MYRAIKFNYCLLSIRPSCLFRVLFSNRPISLLEPVMPRVRPIMSRYLRPKTTANRQLPTANGQWPNKGNLFSHNFLNRPHLRSQNVVQKPFSRQIITSWPEPTLLTALGDKSPKTKVPESGSSYPSHHIPSRLCGMRSESVKYRINSFELALLFWETS